MNVSGIGARRLALPSSGAVCSAASRLLRKREHKDRPLACKQAATGAAPNYEIGRLGPGIRNSTSGLSKNDYGGAVTHWLAVEFPAFSPRVFAKAIDTNTVADFAETFKLSAHFLQIGFGDASYFEYRILHPSAPAEKTAGNAIAPAIVLDVIADQVILHLVISVALLQRAALDPGPR